MADFLSSSFPLIVPFTSWLQSLTTGRRRWGIGIPVAGCGPHLSLSCAASSLSYPPSFRSPRRGSLAAVSPYPTSFRSPRQGSLAIIDNKGCNAVRNQYLDGSKVMLILDHKAVNQVLNSSPTIQYSQRIDKYRMALMPYLENIDIIYKPGPGMVMIMINPLSKMPPRGDRLEAGVGNEPERRAGGRDRTGSSHQDREEKRGLEIAGHVQPEVMPVSEAEDRKESCREEEATETDSRLECRGL
jgi:hypothetical protein